MFEAVKDVRARLTELASELEPKLFHARDAAALVEELATIERLVASMRSLLAARVAETSVWREQGDRSAAEWLAKKAGTTVGQAQAAIATGRRVADQPRVREAMLAGTLSSTQAAEITAAVDANPASEESLLEAAVDEPLKNLRERCAQARAAGEADEAARHQAIRDRRFLRSWTDGEGAFRFEGCTTADHGARLMTAVERERDRLAAEHRDQARTERVDARALDALVNLVDRDDAAEGGVTRTVVHVRVDWQALVRGHTDPGEVCEMPGFGPVPVALVDRMMGDALLRVLLVDGHDVTRVATASRVIPASVRVVVDERDQVCVVPGCNRRDHLEYHHLLPRRLRGPTSAANLAKVCGWHHDLITYDGYVLEGRPGDWAWHPPPLALAG